jgi:hypothetical protein
MKNTVTRFALKIRDKYMTNVYGKWSENIWEARLFREKPISPISLIKDGTAEMVMVSITYEELPYKVKQ